MGQSHWVPSYPCTPYPVPLVPLVPLVPTSVPQINEHIQIQAFLTVVNGSMGAPAVYGYVMTVRPVAVDRDTGTRDTNHVWMTAWDGRKLVKAASEAGIVWFYAVIIGVGVPRIGNRVDVSPIGSSNT